MKKYPFLLLVILLANGCLESDEPTSSLRPDDPSMIEVPTTTEDPRFVAENTPFPWPSYDDALATGIKEGKPILIDIYAPWCGWCARMQEEVYGNATLASYVQSNFSHGRLNMDDTLTVHEYMGYSLTSQHLSWAFGAKATPTTVFLDPQGVYITRLEGFIALDTFGNVLQRVAAGDYNQATSP